MSAYQLIRSTLLGDASCLKDESVRSVYDVAGKDKIPEQMEYHEQVESVYVFIIHEIPQHDDWRS